MSIRVISSGGQVVGYQAIGGAGRAGLSAYFPARVPGAWGKAAAMSVGLEVKAALQRKPLDPLRGLRLTLRPSRDADRPPLRYVEALWQVNGKARHRSYSAEKYGIGVALGMAMGEMAAAGRVFDDSPASVLAELNRRYAVS